MGACFMQRTRSFFIKLGTIYDLGLSKKWLDDKGTKFLCTMCRVSAAMSVSDESDYSTSSNRESVSSGSESSSSSWEEFVRVEPFSAVARVVKSLNWRVARKLCFAKAVERYDFDRSFAAYRMLVNVYATAQLEEEVFALIGDIVSYYQKVGLDLFNIMFLLLEEPGDAKRSSFVVNVLMKVFAASNRIFYNNAVDVFVKSKKIGIDLDIRCCNFLLNCLAENNKGEALLAVFEEMKNSGPFPCVHTYTIVMKFYCKRGEVELEEATVLLEEMRASRITPSVVTLNTYINGLCRVGEVDRAWEFLQDSKPLLNCYCYSSVIRGFVNKGELDKAIYVFDELKRNGIHPDVYSFCIQIGGFCRYGNVEKGFSLYQEMRNNSLKPSPVAYASILKVLSDNRWMEQLLQVFRDMGKSGLELIFNILTTWLCARGEMDKANTLVEEMMAMDLCPSCSCYKSLILGFSKMGSSEKALTFFNLMATTQLESSRGMLPISVVTCNHVIGGFCKERRFEEALRFIYEMRHNKAGRISSKKHCDLSTR